MTFFGLKLGQDLKNRAAHPHQEFPVVPPRGPTTYLKAEVIYRIPS